MPINYVFPIRLAHLTSVFLVPLDLQILNQFQPHVFNLTSFKLTEWDLSTPDQLRRLNSFVIMNSYSQVLSRYILYDKLKVLVPDWICLVVLKNMTAVLQ